MGKELWPMSTWLPKLPLKTVMNTALGYGAIQLWGLVTVFFAATGRPVTSAAVTTGPPY